MSFNPYFISYTNINSKWLLDLLIEAKTKHPGKKKKKNRKKNLCDLGVRKTSQLGYKKHNL